MNLVVLCSIFLCFPCVISFNIYSDFGVTRVRRDGTLDNITYELTANDTVFDFINENITDSAETKDNSFSSDINESSFSAFPVEEIVTSEYISTSEISEGKMNDSVDSSSLMGNITSTEANHYKTTFSYTSKMTEMTSEKVISSDTSSPPLLPPKNATCHLECSSILNNVTFYTVPNATLLKAGTSLTLECSVSANQNSSARLIWLFQGTDSSENQCCLTHQKEIAPCDSFSSIDHIVDTNITSGYIKEVVIIDSLVENNSGYYYCKIELSCCSPSQTMERIYGNQEPLRIYSEDYSFELQILASTTAILLVIIIIGTVLQNRQRKGAYKSLLIVDAPISGDVLHAPILEDDDSSFGESEDEES